MRNGRVQIGEQSFTVKQIKTMAEAWCTLHGWDRQNTDLDALWKRAWGNYDRQQKADFAAQLIRDTSPNMIPSQGGQHEQQRTGHRLRNIHAPRK